MTYYKETQIGGTKWQRCYKIEATNDLDGIPTITFYEEEVADIGGDKMKKQVGIIQIQYSDPTKSFDLIHPETGANLGTSTHGEFYLALYSLYLASANERDNPPVPPQE